MHLPDARKRNSDPAYLRELLAKAGISQNKAAKQIGITPRGLRYYLVNIDREDYREAPYPVQFALECIAKGASK